MKGVIFCLIFTILLNATFSQNPGIEWTEEDYGIIREKVEYIIQEKKDAFSELKSRHDSSFSKSYKNFKPSANKVSILNMFYSRMFCHHHVQPKIARNLLQINVGLFFKIKFIQIA